MTEQRFPNFDVCQFLTDKKIDHRKHDAEDHTEIAMNCPACVERGEPRPDEKLRLWIAPERGTFCCYNCGWDGNLIHFVMKVAQVGVRGALKIMRGKTNVLEYLNFSLCHDAERDESDEIAENPEISFPHGFESFDEVRRKTVFHDYLKRRGIPLAYAKAMGWGFSTVGYTKNRLVVPTYMNDRLVFWQARDVLEGGKLTGKAHELWKTPDYKKVLNPKGVSSRKVIYGYDAVKACEEVVLVEGFVDASKIGDAGAAINGKALHAAQVEALAALPKLKRIVLVFDNDAWTDQRHHRNGPRLGKMKKPCSIEVAKRLLSVYFEVRAVRLPDDRDPGRYPVGGLDDVIWPKARRRASDKA